MISITPSIYKIIHQKLFSKILTRNFDQCEGFRWRPGPFTAIPSICNQRSLYKTPIKDPDTAMGFVDKLRHIHGPRFDFGRVKIFI